MRQIDVEGDVDEIRERLASLLGYSGFQVSRVDGDTLRFRKVRLAPSRRLPLSVYGSGVVKLRALKEGTTRVACTLHISPITIFAYLVTGLSVLALEAFVSLSLLTSGTGSTTDALLGFVTLNIAALLTILVVIFSFVKSIRRAEKFLRSSLKKHVR